MVEELAPQLGETGASVEDLSDSLVALKRIDVEPRPDMCFWIPLLEQRLASALQQAYDPRVTEIANNHRGGGPAQKREPLQSAHDHQ